MKITKNQLKQIIREEMQATATQNLHPELEKLIHMVDHQIERIPSANREAVRSALAARLSYKIDDPIEEDG